MSKLAVVDPISVDALSKEDQQKLEPVIRRLTAHYHNEELLERVIAEAKETWSPLHRFFDWNDTQAAHKFRQLQAARLVVLVKVETQPAVPEPTKPARVSYKGKDGKPSGTEERSQTDVAEVERRAALRDLSEWWKRYRHIQHDPHLVLLLKEIEQRLKTPDGNKKGGMH